MRYLIADEIKHGKPHAGLWEHFRHPDDKLVPMRFVFDLEERNMVAVQVRHDANGGWTDAIPEDVADLKDSLINANEMAIEKPEYYGLFVADEMPDWAQMQSAPRP